MKDKQFKNALTLEYIWIAETKQVVVFLLLFNLHCHVNVLPFA